MELQKSALVLADISGYTRFVVLHRMSMFHAEQIITELIEAIAEKARYPLHLNKLEGDAAFFVARLDDGDRYALDDIMAQVRDFFAAFRDKQSQQVANTIGGCRCDACQTLENLKLKVIVHAGDVIEKRVGEFREVAGESVIIAHRLLKNSIEDDEYLLVTEDAAALLSDEPFPDGMPHSENIPEFGDIGAKVYAPQGPTVTRPADGPLISLQGMRSGVATSWNATLQRARGRKRSYRNLPS